MASGLEMALASPVAVDLKYIFHTNQAGISYASPFGSVGYLVACMAIFFATAPFCTHIWMLYGSHFLAWMGAAIFESSQAVWVIEMWGDNNPPVLQLSYMLYGLGGILGPLLVRPYLTGDISHTSTTTMGSVFQTTTDSSVDDINYSIDRRAKLRTPFMIAAAIVPEVVTQEADPDVVDNTERIDKKDMDNRCYASNVVNYFQYIPIHMSSQAATDFMMATTAASTVARLISTYISSKLRPEIMLTYHLVIISVAFGLLYFGQKSVTFMWIGSIGFSAMWSTFFVFGEKYIKLTNKITSVLCFSTAVLTFVSPFIIGNLIERHAEGLLMAMWPPTSVDMKYMFHTTQASISYATPFGSAGSQAVWLIEMWADKSPPVLQLSQMLYSLGSVFGPLLVRPYLTGDISHTSTTTMGSVFQTTTDISVEDINYSIDRRAKLQTPFLIAGAIAILGPIILLIMFVVKRYKVPEIGTQETDPDVVDNTVDTIAAKVTQNGSMDNKLVTSGSSKIRIIFFAACQVCYSINAVNYFQYIPIHMSAQRATDFMMATTAASIVGRLVSAFISSLGFSAMWS
ncbi:unnamed protein product, partial [Medioppia subpectinata]